MKVRLLRRLIAACLSATLAIAITHAQSSGFSYWTAIAENSFEIKGERQIIPSKYIVQSLDFEGIKNRLQTAPLEFTAGCWNAAIVIELPMPDGRTQRFRVIESPIVEAPLAARFPQIRTFLGQGIDDRYANVRMDFTHKGFHAMIYSPNGTVFIDPYSSRTTSEYLVYYRKDFTDSGEAPFTCGVENEANALPQVPGNFGKVLQPPPVRHQAPDFQLGDCKLRTYRLALAATGEYTTYHGGLVQDGLAAQIVSMNRVNGIYETDLGIRMILVANNHLVIYTDGNTDPFTNSSGSTMLNQNQTNMTNVIGSANYDIGHVFSTGGGGIAQLNSPCSAGNKAKGVTGRGAPVGDPFDVDYVIHEMGHQFGANHTQNNNCNRASTACYEPGSASTAMGYAGICTPNVQSNSDAYFHGYSIEEIKNFTAGAGNTCASTPAYTNSAPVIGSYTASQTIPKSTPFALTASVTDVDGNALTYCWEQLDVQVSTQPPVSTATGGPNFRSFNPSAQPTRYFPRLAQLTGTPPATDWEVLSSVARTMNFRLVVRDNAPGGGCNAHQDITLTISGTAGPFVVTAPNTNVSWAAGSTQTVTWSVAGTNASPVNCANVDILLSTDGGLTYPTVLATAVPNNGSASVIIPDPPSTTARVMIRGNGKAFFDISDANFTITSTTCTAPVINAPTLTQPTCAVQSGTIVVNPSASGREYSIDNGANWQSSNTFAGLAPGNYNIRVRQTGSPACYTVYAANPVVINAVPLAPVITTPTVTQPTCPTPTGTIVVSANAGVNAMQYSVVSGIWQTSRTFSGLAPGSYPIMVRLTNDNTCVTQYSANPVVLNAPPAPPVVTAPTVVLATCATPTGAITVNATAGGTMQYSITPGVWQSSATFSNVAAGSYTVAARLVSDNTCATNYSGNPVVLTAAPALPSLTAPTVTQATCALPVGTIEVNANAGGTLQYSITPGVWQSSPTFSNVAAGSYTVAARLVSDNACATNYSGNPVVLTAAPALPSLTAPTVTQATCAVPVGTIAVNATAGGTLQYSITPGVWQSSATFSNVAAGSYTIAARLVSDNTCATNYSGNPVVLTAAPALPSVTTPTVIQPVCNTPTGTIAVNATARGAMQYSITPGVWQNSGTFSNLPAGSYNIAVRLASDPACVTNYSGNPVVINSGGAPTINFPTVIQPFCTDPTGTIVVNANAAGNALQHSIVNGIWQNSAIFTGLAPGNYYIRVRLASDPTCQVEYVGNPVVITPLPPLPALTATTPSSNPVCEGTPVSVTVAGLPSKVEVLFEYTIDGASFSLTDLTTLAGTYTFPEAVYDIGVHTFSLDVVTIAGCSTPLTVNNTTEFTVMTLDECAPKLAARVYFDNAYNTTNNLMNDGLRFYNKIPLSQPYSTITFTGTQSTAPYTGTETTTTTVLGVTGANAIVDWVMIELRNAANRSIVEARRAALLQRDGDIVDVDGVSPVKFVGLASGNYHVAIRHRLCLATRTQTALSFNLAVTTPLDLTNNSNALANSLAPVTIGPNTVYMMYVGDCDRNGFILAPEINLIRGMLNTIPANIQYFTRNLDLTFDAFILTSDITALRKNLNKIQVNLSQ